MKSYFFLLWLGLAITMATSCKPKKTETHRQDDPSKFEGLITGYTSGVVPAGSNISILTARPVQGFQPGTELPGGIVTLSPQTKGKAIVQDSYTVVFIPGQALQAGQRYEVALNLHRLFDVPKTQQQFVFSFRVIEQDFTVFRGRTFMPDMNNPHQLQYEGKMVTADVMTVEDASRLLRAKSPHSEFEVEVISDGVNTFSYIIEDIPRLEEEYRFEVLWDGHPVNIDKRGSFEVEIASVNEFKLLSYEVNRDDQSILLVFSDPVDPGQQIAGLVRIADIEDVRISRSGTAVTLFSGERLKGEQKVVIDRSVRSAKGNLLGETINVIVAMEALPPKVEVIGSGNIMPDSEGLSLPFRAVSLRAVDVTVYKIFSDNVKQFYQNNRLDGSSNLHYVGRPVFMKTVRLDQNPGTDLSQWNGFSVDLTQMVKTDPTAIYRVKFSFKKDYADYDCGEGVTAPPETSPINMSDEETAYWDGNSSWYNDWPDNYNWRDRDNPCTDSYYVGNRFPARNILYSNLGILAKSADNRTYNIAVTDLLTTAPVVGAKVEFFSFQRQALGETTTTSTGMAEITLDNAPYIVSATHGEQRSWLRLDNGTSLSLSNFDVAGKEVQKGIKGFIYGERGVWRPGDTLFLTFVMDDVTSRLPAEHPVLFELFDARGNLAEKQVKSRGVDNFYTFITTTKPDAATGNWKAKVSVGGAVFEKRLKIEHIKPNRLKMDIDFGKDILTAGDRTQRGRLEASWLHGTPAAGLRATIELTLLQTDHKFEGYEEFTFSNPSKNFRPSEEVIFDEKLDPNGKATVPLHLETNRYAPGMLSAVFITRVFEQGGDFSTDVFRMPFAPFPRFAGIKIAGVTERNNRMETDREHLIEVVTLDNSGKPVSQSNLELKIYKLSWRWWWGANNDNLAGWISGQGSELIKQEQFKTTNGKAKHTFRIDYPDWGHYFVEIHDPSGGHSTGKLLFFDWPSHISRAGRQNPAGATMLAFSAGKEKYFVGENAAITFPSSDGARALISIESGSEVLMSRWVDCKENETVFEFEITRDMTPNVYAHITLLQPHHQTANDLPIRMYGVIPVMVEDPQTILEPVIRMAETIRPESDYSIRISEENGRAMTYTLAVVDEGLLGLTRFSTPNPWHSFYAREALGVKTWDLFDDVLGAYGGQIQKILAIGGDAELLKMDDQKANRFKPVVTFAGPFPLDENSDRSHTFKMDNYIGEVRVMVIAGKAGAWGAAEKSVTVKQPLMVLPTLPRVLSPKEEVMLPVSVFAMDNNIREVKISIVPSGMLTAAGDTEQNLSFSATGEQMVFFKLKTGIEEGIGKIKIIAGSGNETATAEIEIDVVHPNPLTAKAENHVIGAQEQKEITLKYHGIEGTNSGAITVSGLPSFDLEKNLHQLLRYPYGCLEQIVSAGFAQLYLDDILPLTDKEKVRTDKNIRAVISKLPDYRMAGGMLAYWPGSRYTSRWSAVYAGHFMFLAGQKGYAIPENLTQEWLEHQYNLATRFDPSQHLASGSARFIQAYRLYVLALAGKPAFSAMNRLREDPSLQQSAAWRLAAAYLLAGRPEAAGQLVEKPDDIQPEQYRQPGETFGSELRDQAMILETLVLMNDKTGAFELLTQMAKDYQGGYMSTQTAAFTLYSLARYIRLTGSEDGMNFSYTLDGKTENIRTDQPVFNIITGKDDDEKTVLSVKNNGDGDLFVTTTAIGKPDYGTEETDAHNLNMQISYFTIDGQPLDVTSLKQGTDFVAVISIKNTGVRGNYQNMALSYTVPSGWEIQNKRLHDMEATTVESAFNYRDIRDDRVDTFFDLEANKTVTFRIELNAAYGGSFYLPAVSCEAMYDHTIFAVEKGKWVEVVR
jgi:alpha-2-macroglobulin